MRKLLRHPVTHIIALGVLAFALHLLIFGERATSDYVITVTEGDVEQMLTRWRMTFRRAPTKEELISTIENHIREEVFFREAKLLGLEKDDIIIRRRLSQKMDFLSRDLASLVEPTEQAILDFYEKNREKYREPPLVTFSHIYFNVDKHGVLEARDFAVETRLELNAKTDSPANPQEYGDPFVLQHYYPEMTPLNVESTFGEQEFVDSLFTFELGVWHGPIVSAYGLHLVYVYTRIETRMPPLEEVKEKVTVDLMDELRRQANDIFYSSLRSNYEIKIDEKIASKYDIDTWQRSRE